jgi:thioredoxin 1
MADLNLTSKNFNQEVLENKGVSVVDFWAPWCGPCQAVSPVIEDLAKEYTGKVKVAKVSVDDNSDLASQFSIMSLPTVVFFKNGQPIRSIIGAQGKENYKQEIEALFSS